MKRRLLSPGRLAAALAVAAIVLAALDAIARPGGGGSFHGGGGGGGGGGFSGGGGGGGGLALWLIFSMLPWPLKIVFIIGLVVYGIMKQRSAGRRMADWSTMGDASTMGGGVQPYAPAPALSPRATLATLRRQDPAFSLVLFEDFLYALYAEAHQRRARGELDLLSAYLSPEVISRMSSAPREPIQGIVIGAMRYASASITGDGPGAMVTVAVELEVNLTVASARGSSSAYLVERWSLARRAGARSRAAERARIFDCPSCGAPQSAVMAGRCSHCNQAVSTGDFGWVVRSVEMLKHEARPPLLTTDVAEEGNDLPTIVDRGARAAMDALVARDPSFEWPAFEQRVGLIFNEFQVAWSNRDLAKMRPFLSDNLMQMQSYWVEAYRAQRMRNVTEKARIERIHLARIDSDASFDAITVRLFGVSLDYTVTDDGKLVCGSRSRERRYTEYWTLIRGASRKGPTRTDAACPSCGAPLDINMAGTCKYCQAKVTSGEFDWVLSRIEQDEAYTG